MRLADFMASALSELGISQVFGVTGRGSLFLTDGIARSKEIDFVPMFHEQSAGFAANAVVQSGAPISACIVSSGVAATNLFTPLLNAWQDQLTTLFVTGQNHSASSTSRVQSGIRTFGEQETDVVAMAKHLTKSTLYVENPQLFPEHFVALIEESRRGRPGPILVDIPLDHQSARISDLEAIRGALERLRGYAKVWDLGEASRQNEFLDWAKFSQGDEEEPPLFLLGPSFDQLLSPQFVLDLQNSSNVVVCEQGANSKYSGGNYLGTVGFLACNPNANKALFAAQRVVAVGTSFRNNLCLPDQSLISSNAEILLVDFDPDDVSPHLKVRKMFFAPPSSDVQAGLRAVLSPLSVVDSRARKDLEAGDWAELGTTVDLNSLAVELGSLLPDDAIVVVDSGFCQLIVSGQGVFGPNQRLIQPHSQGCMGVALAAGFGIAKSNPDSPVVIIVGDGSMMMNPQDLNSIASLPKNLALIVVDNGLYAIIGKRQKELFRDRTIGTSELDGIPPVDLKAVIEASGLQVEDERGTALRDIMSLQNFSSNRITRAFLISGNPRQDFSTCKVVFEPNLGESRLITSPPA